MNLTYSEIEAVADCLRKAGFDISDMDNDQIADIVQCVLDALDIEV